MGAVSSMRTISPALKLLSSSCAWYFFERRMILPYMACFTLRSTLTTTVLSVLSETMVPTRIRLGIVRSLSLNRLARMRTLGAERLDAGDVAANFLDPRGALQLIGRGLKAQVELLALQFGEVGGQLIVAFYT